MTGPQMRASQQPILSLSAQRRIGSLLQSSALNLRLSSETSASLEGALEAFARGASGTDSTRQIEKALGRLLIQCGAAQKEVKAQLNDESLPKYYEALDCGLWERP